MVTPNTSPDSTLALREAHEHEPELDPAKTSNALLSMQAIKYRIPGDVVAKAVRDLPDEQRAALRWLDGYARQRNLDPDALSSLLKKDGKTSECYSYSSVYAVLTGRRQEQGANIAPVVAAIERLRSQVEGQSRVTETGFVETRLSKAITARCQRALKRQKILFIFGDSQIGKTESLVHYQKEHNHGETIYVSAPIPASLMNFLEQLALSLGIPSQQRQADLRRRIIDSFDSKMLLIVDEAHEFLNGRGQSGIQALAFIRELYNRSKCGIVLAMTNEGKREMLTGSYAVRLKQLWNRRIVPLQLPKSVPVDDLALFAAAHGLEPAPNKKMTVRTPFINDLGEEDTRDYSANPYELQSKVTAEEGLGVWLTILQDAQDMAEEQHRAVSWQAVLKAYCLSQADAEVWS